MLELKETTAADPDFVGLAQCLDKEFFEEFGVLVDQYAPNNRLEALQWVVVAHIKGRPVGCGGFRPIGDGAAELKRVFVQKDCRRQGVAEAMLQRLEQRAADLGYGRIVLETGKALLPAVALYEKLGYRVIESYGPYAGDEICVCMGKELK